MPALWSNKNIPLYFAPQKGHKFISLAEFKIIAKTAASSFGLEKNNIFIFYPFVATSFAQLVFLYFKRNSRQRTTLSQHMLTHTAFNPKWRKRTVTTTPKMRTPHMEIKAIRNGLFVSPAPFKAPEYTMAITCGT